MTDPLECAVVEAVRRVLTRRAARLRANAAQLTTTTTDGRGRLVVVGSPEGAVMLSTADFFVAVAEDVIGGSS